MLSWPERRGLTRTCARAVIAFTATWCSERIITDGRRELLVWSSGTEWGGGVSITKSQYEANFMYRGIKRRLNVLSRVLFQNKVSQRHLHKERATQTSLSSHSSQLHLQDGVGRCRFGLHTQNPSYHVLSYYIPKTWFNMQFFNYCHSGQLRLYWHWIFTVKHSIAVYEHHTLLCLNELYVLCVFNTLACN